MDCEYFRMDEGRFSIEPSTSRKIKLEYDAYHGKDGAFEKDTREQNAFEAAFDGQGFHKVLYKNLTPFRKPKKSYYKITFVSSLRADYVLQLGVCSIRY